MTPRAGDERPLVSVVVPAYNAAATIEDAIESVLAQTCREFELIVVDDGSTDDTAPRVAQYTGDERIRLLSQENRGQAAARNTAVEASRGTFVSLLDSDDLYAPNYLERMVGALDKNESAAVAYTDAWVFDDRTGRVARRTLQERSHPASVPADPLSFLRAMLKLGNFVFVAAMIRREVLADVGPFRLGIEGSEDAELWLRISAKGYSFVRVAEPLAAYRRREGQATANAAAMDKSASSVFRIVETEYELTDELRELARLKLPLTRSRAARPRRVPMALQRPYRALSALKNYYVRPPRAFREAFPDLL